MTADELVDRATGFVLDNGIELVASSPFKSSWHFARLSMKTRLYELLHPEAGWRGVSSMPDLRYEFPSIEEALAFLDTHPEWNVPSEGE